MAHIRIPRPWALPEREATPESVYLDRRRFLKTAGLAAAGAALWAGAGCTPSDGSAEDAGWDGTLGTGPSEPDLLAAREPDAPPVRAGLWEWTADHAARHAEATRNPRYLLDRPLTPESVNATYNNFYEFTEVKDRVWRLVHSFEPRPWTVEVRGLVEEPLTLDVEDLVRTLPVEERLYRHRCVEAWAMTIPWSGIPMRAFVGRVRPLSSARYVRMVSFHRPEQAPGFEESHWYPWPYFEGLTMAEATNELALLATGAYGHPLLKQHGAPIRLVTPWKYGFKSIKSIVLFEFTDRLPPTFWNRVAPTEYDFLANVNPKVPHPRWSQATERVIGTRHKVRTLPFNGYGEFVARLYG